MKNEQERTEEVNSNSSESNQPEVHSQLDVEGELIWKNPTSLGHFGVRLRKEAAEQWLVDRISEGVPPAERARLFKTWLEEDTLNK